MAASVRAALGDRLFPRLIDARALRELKELHPLPSQPLGETGLHVVCAIDGERQIAYFTQRHLRALGGDFSPVLARAPRGDRVVCNRPWKVAAQGISAV
uniref:Uncharacterized protein n=1 Tax=Schlesneria paludicola TaxID=360056 RepID=A0A7C4QT39_9PLAN